MLIKFESYVYVRARKITEFKSRQLAEQMTLLDMKFFQNIEVVLLECLCVAFVAVFVLSVFVGP